jgi:putative addiction module component (TIGR02574 family)
VEAHSVTEADLTDLLKLTPEQKLDLIEALWDSIPSEAVPIPDWHHEVLAEREAIEVSDLGDTWDIVKARLLKQP